MSIPGYDFRVLFQAVAAAALLLGAWRWGGGPERCLALILGWFQIADPINHALFQAEVNLQSLNIGHVVIDVMALGAALAVALFANRIYPLWFAAFQIVATLAHFARETTRAIAPLAYGIMYIGPSYFQIIILAGGLWLHSRRVRRCGPYRSWRMNSLHPSTRPPGVRRGA